MRWTLDGRMVLITGAARGIGAESARRLAGRGPRVSLVGLEGERLEQVAGEIGEGAARFEAEVTDFDALQARPRWTSGSSGTCANGGPTPRHRWGRAGRPLARVL